MPDGCKLDPDLARRIAQVTGFRRFGADPSGVRFVDAGGAERFVSAGQLHDDAPVRFAPVSGQRTRPAVAADDMRLTAVAQGGDAHAVSFAFDRADPVTMPMAWLGRLADERRAAPQAAPPRRAVLQLTDIRRFPAQRFCDDPSVRRLALAAVARSGIALLHDFDEGRGGLETIGGAFGFVRETNYGRLFDVSPSPNASNLAFTDAGLALHTDNPYRDDPPALQLLHCLEAAADGGDSLAADGFHVAEAFREAAPEQFDLLAQTPVLFRWSDGRHHLESRAPVISLDPCGGIRLLRVNDRALAPLDIAADRREAWRAAYRMFSAMLARATITFRLDRGEVLIMDNARILHGRTAFKGAGRRLQGCYADRCGLLSTLAVLEQTEADARADQMLNLLRGSAGDAAYGEMLSMRSHALQAAELARAAGFADELVLAALLHDIGWASGDEAHEAAGADAIRPLFGEKAARPVALHVAAKRYLVAVEENYAAALSPASVRTLAAQGGPMTAEEVEAFEATPGFADALALRRLDDLAKTPDAEEPPLDSFRPLLVEAALDLMKSEG